MYAHVRTLATLGAVVLLALFGGALTDQGKAWADFDFTFTHVEDTVMSATTWDTVEFHALLTNTGTDIDSYLVTLTENPPTPDDWWVELCAAGQCWDSLITQVNVYLEPTWEDHVLLHVIPRSVSQGHYLVTVQSYGSPGLKLTKSMNFMLNAHGGVPTTNQWGLIALVGLILTSGLYLTYRRLKPAKQR
ncbi:MAG: hypothetical protein JSV10_10860 [Candidatus Zixiibacteriota bacterium]|nr:MAG: hypothetical protein JSV10_10860 [candidate division Zixibacteria bacterium]